MKYFKFLIIFNLVFIGILFAQEKGTDDYLWLKDLDQKNIDLEENLFKKNYYIIFDGSGSMSGRKLLVAKKAVKEFVKSVHKDANIGLAVFDKLGLSERVPLGNNRDLLTKKIDEIIALRSTPLRDSIIIGYNSLLKQAVKQLGYGEYNLVIITDGHASKGQEPNIVVNKILKESPVIIHTIGFQIGTTHSLNQPGKTIYKSANNLEELRKGLKDVLAESENFTVTDFDN